MPAYWLARCRIDDPFQYRKYTDLVPRIIARFGGKVLARGTVAWVTLSRKVARCCRRRPESRLDYAPAMQLPTR